MTNWRWIDEKRGEGIGYGWEQYRSYNILSSNNKKFKVGTSTFSAPSGQDVNFLSLI